MQLTNIELKSVVLHEALFVVGVGALGPTIGTGSTVSTPSKNAKLFLSGNFLVIKVDKNEVIVPLSNVKSMIPLKPIED